MPSPSFTEQARADIREAAQWIQQQDRKAASAWTDGLLQQCRLLARHPGLGRVRPELSIDTRVFPFRRT